MSLEGNLTAFGLSEILQLIAVQQKSGMLRVTSDGGARVLFFREGKIISTRDRRRKTRDPLRDYLTRYGILTREDLIRATHLAQQAKLDVTDVIVSEEILDEEEMRKHFRNHIQEATYEVLTWEQCSYKFIPGTDIIDGIKTWGEFNIEGILMESMRRIDEFPAMKEEFPQSGARITRKKLPSEDQQLTTNESTVMAMLRQERTIDYLIAHGKIPQFEIYEALKHLREKDLITVGEAVDIEETSARSGKRRKRRATPNLLPLLTSLALFIACTYWGGKYLLPRVYAYTLGRGSVPIATTTIPRHQVEMRLRWMLRAYYAEHGRYPQSLSELQKSGLADDGFLVGVKSHSFIYYLTENNRAYTLL